MPDAQGIAALVGAFVALVTTAIAVVRYLSRRDKQIAAREAFRSVVDSLSSGTKVQKLGAAILLRRFFDPETEVGQGRTPYAREAMDVIAAILRDVETGDFQKLLADGLRYAPSLAGADLQRTNLQKAYLGRKGNVVPNLSGADFYRADLSGASLKGAKASEAVFYQARLHNTILRDADLTRASFFESDLLGANFKGARLQGAGFQGARNLPPGLAERIGADGTYAATEPFLPPDAGPAPDTVSVFLSKPGTVSAAQRELVEEVRRQLAQEGFDIASVDREDYPAFGAVSEVRRVLSGCRGLVVLGFRQIDIHDATWRAGTAEAGELKGVGLPTAWNHIESGMAAMAGLPTLVVAEQGVVGGLFDLGGIDHVVRNIDLAKPDHAALRRAVTAWCRSVREGVR